MTHVYQSEHYRAVVETEGKKTVYRVVDRETHRPIAEFNANEREESEGFVDFLEKMRPTFIVDKLDK